MKDFDPSEVASTLDAVRDALTDLGFEWQHGSADVVAECVGRFESASDALIRLLTGRDPDSDTIPVVSCSRAYHCPCNCGSHGACFFEESDAVR
jgi:hypothetical protein